MIEHSCHQDQGSHCPDQANDRNEYGKKQPPKASELPSGLGNTITVTITAVTNKDHHAQDLNYRIAFADAIASTIIIRSRFGLLLLLRS